MPQQGGGATQAEAQARVRIEGVTTLGDYAATQRLLQSVSGVRRANVAAADAAAISFDVTVRGGAAALEQGLAGVGRLARVNSPGNQLVYRYQPQG